MPNTYFQFKEFRIDQEKSGMKVTTDGCLFGSWVANELEKSDPERILDIGAGTGLLSLMLAQKTSSIIDAVEINKQAYQESTQNFKESKWKDRVRCHHSSLQDFQSNDKYDLIICNPPFFKDSQLGSNQNKNQAIHSTTLSSQDLLSGVLRLLKPSGEFYLMYPEQEMNAFRNLAQKKGLFPIQKVIVQNQKDQSAFRMMGEFRLNRSEEQSRELIIRNKDRRYTPKSWELLKDYLLEYNDPNFPSNT